jgi:hypothetical protein
MEILKSLRLLVIGVLKRIYWILPTLVLDPFDFAERLLNVSYDVPQWAVWVLFAAGWVVAILLSYHELRMQKVALEKPPNWIEKYRNRYRKLPPLPDYLRPVVPSYSPGEPISKNMELITPSAQFWNRLLPSQQDELLELVEWLGQDRRDYLAHMRMMLPPGGSKSIHLHWRPPERR